jgi:NAD-dependent deacetylase
VAHRDFAAARPNAGHLTLARWEAAGRLHGVITQNIDGLHQDAGSRRVLELHGTARFIRCLDCGARYPADGLVRQFEESRAVPPCPQCHGGLLKHATISFGQALDPDVLGAASAWAESCDLCLALGSSLVVEPAASLPRLALNRGARLVIINVQPTPLDKMADAVLHSPLGETLGYIDEALQPMQGS